jgi:hypothetical protein
LFGKSGIMLYSSPSSIIAAAESWKKADIPKIFIRIV